LEREDEMSFRIVQRLALVLAILAGGFYGAGAPDQGNLFAVLTSAVVITWWIRHGREGSV
jgi:hypothetical protein